jgi:hypothetical protein
MNMVLSDEMAFSLGDVYGRFEGTYFLILKDRSLNLLTN